MLQVDHEAQVECLRDLCLRRLLDEVHPLAQPSMIVDPEMPLTHYGRSIMSSRRTHLQTGHSNEMGHQLPIPLYVVVDQRVPMVL